jgi:aminopeptidase YwaD
LMAASRALVPADYTSGDRFAHDPALPLSPWPVLQPVRALAVAAEGDSTRFARVGAQRACNRMQHALVAAMRALSAA